MSMVHPRQLMGLVLVSAIATLSPLGVAQAEDWKWTSGGTERGQWMFGFRAGFATLTQTLSQTLNVSTDVGPLINAQGMYGLNKWVMAGFMVEWERHAASTVVGNTDLGHQDTVSLLPTIAVRPGRFGPIAPYISTGLGVNVNSFGSSVSGLNISPSNNVAWRLAWGADYFLTAKLALNAEMAYLRNDGHVTINGSQTNDWNASSFGFLFGVRLFL